MERQQRQLRRERWRGEALGAQRARAETRGLLGSLVVRKFGRGTAARTAGLLAGISDGESLRLAGEWIIDCASGDELVERLRRARARRL